VQIICRLLSRQFGFEEIGEARNFQYEEGEKNKNRRGSRALSARSKEKEEQEGKNFPFFIWGLLKVGWGTVRNGALGFSLRDEYEKM